MTSLLPSPSSTRTLFRRRGQLLRGIGRVAAGATITLSLATLAGSSAADAATFSARLGTVTATLTFQGSATNPHGTTITITNAGHVVYHAAVSTPLCGTYCSPQPAYYPNNGNPLRVVRLEPGAPDVVLGLYSGGAHCCFTDLVFEPRSSGAYAAASVNLGDPGARIVTLPGNPFAAFVTADDSFAYAFTDFAASGLPIKVVRVMSGRVTDVTRQYPALIRADASSWLGAFYAQASTHYDDSVGVIAAWAADEYLLGRGASARQFLRQQAAAGHLNSLLNPSVKATAFVAALEKFLSPRGY